MTERMELERKPCRVEATAKRVPQTLKATETKQVPQTLKATEIVFTERLCAVRGESQLSCELKGLRETADVLAAEMMEFGLLRPAIIKVSQKRKKQK